MESIGFPISKGYLEIAEFVINADLIDELSERGIEYGKIEKLSADLKNGMLILKILNGWLFG